MDQHQKDSELVRPESALWLISWSILFLLIVFNQPSISELFSYKSESHVMLVSSYGTGGVHSNLVMVSDPKSIGSAFTWILGSVCALAAGAIVAFAVRFITSLVSALILGLLVGTSAFIYQTVGSAIHGTLLGFLMHNMACVIIGKSFGYTEIWMLIAAIIGGISGYNAVCRRQIWWHVKPR